MYAYEYVVYLYYLKSIGEYGVAGQRPSSSSFENILFWFIQEHSVMVPSGTFCSGSFGNILIAV